MIGSVEGPHQSRPAAFVLELPASLHLSPCRRSHGRYPRPPPCTSLTKPGPKSRSGHALARERGEHVERREPLTKCLGMLLFSVPHLLLPRFGCMERAAEDRGTQERRTGEHRNASLPSTWGCCSPVPCVPRASCVSEDSPACRAVALKDSCGDHIEAIVGWSKNHRL